MTDNERIAEAMGWDYQKGVAGRDKLGPIIEPSWFRYIPETDGKVAVESRGTMPDYFTDPALLGEMLEWLAERYGVAIECPTLGGPWTLHLYRDGDLLYEDYAEEGVSLQKAVARCVLWALDREQSE